MRVFIVLLNAAISVHMCLVNYERYQRKMLSIVILVLITKYCFFTKTKETVAQMKLDINATLTSMR